MTIETMHYRRYKRSYSDCRTVAGSYDKVNKTIDVMIPDGRMKPSGVRGQKFLYLTFKGTELHTGRAVECTIKAISVANAVKRLPKDCVWDI